MKGIRGSTELMELPVGSRSGGEAGNMIIK